MKGWQTQHQLQDIVADLPRFAANITAFAARLTLATAGLEVDHLSLRCHKTATAERWRQGFEASATLLSENKINGRTICLFKLPQPVRLADWSISVIELPWPGIRRYAHEGWEHIEVVLRGDAETLFARAQALLNVESLSASDISIKTSQPAGHQERLPNPTLAVTDGRVTIKFHPWSIEEIVASERNERQWPD